MTLSKYLLLRSLMATGLPISCRNLQKQVSQEGCFLNLLYAQLGTRRWQCAEDVPELKNHYTLVRRLEDSRNSIRERIAALREQLVSYDNAQPVQTDQAPTSLQHDKPDALIKEIRYRQDSLLEKGQEMEQLRRVLGESDVIYQEYAREMEILRQHLSHLQSKLASFQQIEVSKESANQQIFDVSRQKLTIALQSLKLNDQQLDTLMEPHYVKIGRYLAEHPAFLRPKGAWKGKDKRLVALIRAVNRSYERLCALCKR